MKADRGKVWLAVSGLVIDDKGRWLVVKKKYGGLMGKWSLPAGFVEPGETVDEAVKREVMEETGVLCNVSGLLGIRTGVIHSSISDNMLIFVCKPLHTAITIQEKELEDVKWMAPKILRNEKLASVMIHSMLKSGFTDFKKVIDGLNPGTEFGYTSYKLFL